MIQKKIANILFSTRLMAILFVVFAIAMAVGTFVENSYSTATARYWIYNARWFELIMILFAINFLGNISRYKLLRKEKWSTLLLHLSFVLVIIGAGVTRYIGYEGVMPIQEGETSDVLFSEKTFLTTYIDGNVDGKPLRRAEDHQVLLAPKAPNDDSFATDFKGQEVTFQIKDFIEGAEQGVIPDENGDKYLKIVESGGGQRHDHYIKEGDVSNIHNVLFAYNKETEGAINIHIDKDNYEISSPFAGSYMRMADRKEGELAKDSVQPLMMRSLYSVAGMQFVFPDQVIKGKYGIVAAKENRENKPDGVTVDVSSGGETKTVKLLGSKGMIGDFQDVSLGGLDIHVRYGSKEYKLPFSIKLNDFIASKYPGTESSYSAFKSKIELIDNGKSTPHEIFMNHVLDYKGYRFFQSGFQPDEKGTILSVNHDQWGTWITYIGYFLLYLGLMWILFDKGSRFGKLEKQLNKIKAKKAKLTVLLALFSFVGFSQTSQDSIKGINKAHEHQAMANQPSKAKIDSVLKATAIPEKQAAKFGHLVIQDARGRMKPANTYSSELLRKISRSDHYLGMDGDQVLVSMTENPAIWGRVPIIHIQSKNDSLHHVIGVKEGEKHVSFAEFFDNEGNYKLAPLLEDAYRTKIKNQFQKDFIEADKRVNLLYQAMQGKLLKIFPIPDDPNNKWLSYPEAREQKGKFKGVDSLYATQVLPLYIQSIRHARSSHDYSKSNDLLKSIQGFQKKYGSEVLPSEQKINTEVFYNNHDIFKGLYWQYALAGSLMFLFVILQIFYKNKGIDAVVTIAKISIIVLFALHTAGLILRWYISGHAPWSDAYESMLYVGWATMFFGLAFGRKSDLTTASTAFVAAIVLMIAQGNWMDPAIANLEPVLNSYWLMIHVAVIVASYGPFTLGMILGLVSLFLMILTTEKNRNKMDLNIQELTIITELALTVGLVMLTIGNFLGGQWANESWGRYWGWDPKETWALISIMVYAFVIHMRLVPGMRSRFAFNWAAVFAYASIMMTYFGVNFYLSGLHSYASGDQIISYKFILIALAIWLILGYLAHRKYLRYYKKRKKISKNLSDL